VADVVDLFTRQARSNRLDTADGVDTGAVEILEGILERAKAGELTGFCLVAGTTSDSTVTAWTKSMFADPYMYLGRLDAVRHEILVDMQRQNEEALELGLEGYREKSYDDGEDEE